MFEKVTVAHSPAGLDVYIGLYRDVKNSRFLREQLLNANSDYDFAFIDARSVGTSSICTGVDMLNSNTRLYPQRISWLLSFVP